jgi:hypothetical protein
MLRVGPIEFLPKKLYEILMGKEFPLIVLIEIENGGGSIQIYLFVSKGIFVLF